MEWNGVECVSRTETSLRIGLWSLSGRGANRWLVSILSLICFFPGRLWGGGFLLPSVFTRGFVEFVLEEILRRDVKQRGGVNMSRASPPSLIELSAAFSRLLEAPSSVSDGMTVDEVQ